MNGLGKFTVTLTVALSLFACSKSGDGGQAPVPAPVPVNPNLNRQIIPNVTYAGGVGPVGQMGPNSRDITDDGRIVNRTLSLFAGESNEVITSDSCASGRNLRGQGVWRRLTRQDQQMLFTFDGNGILTISMTTPAGHLTSQPGGVFYRLNNDHTLDVGNFSLYGVLEPTFVSMELRNGQFARRFSERPQLDRDYGQNRYDRQGYAQQDPLYPTNGTGFAGNQNVGNPNWDVSQNNMLVTSDGFSAYLITSRVTPQDQYAQHIFSGRIESIPMSSSINIVGGTNDSGCYTSIEGQARGQLQ